MGKKVGNVDGSPWIRHQAERQSLPLDALGLDFYHLGENVHKARRKIYGEEDAAGKEWAASLLHTFKHEGYEGAWEQLLPWRLGLQRGRRDAADRLLNYVSERREMIRYPEFVAKGWQIGSGPTEATCKTLTAQAQGFGDALGRGQRRGRDGPGSLVPERPMGGLLAKGATANGLSTPGCFARPVGKTVPTSSLTLRNRGSSVCFR